MVINLCGNSIEDLSPLKNMKALRIVNFKDNNVRMVEALANSKELVNIHLEGNNIKSVENLECLKNSDSLKNLYLQQLSGSNQNPIC